MYKLPVLLITSVFLFACSSGGQDGGGTITGSGEENYHQSEGDNDDNKNVYDGELSDLTLDIAPVLANQFCRTQKQLQVFSRSLLAVLTIRKYEDIQHSCGGTINYDVSFNDLEEEIFNVEAVDYCNNATGQDLTINALINGVTESGGNFTSDIPYIDVVGDGVDLSYAGHTWDGRYNDLFLNMSVVDNLSQTEIVLNDVNVKKGEVDIGWVTYPEAGTFEFKFIKHFNADNTEGQLFFYGPDGEIDILTAENGEITVVHKEDKLDPGVWVDAPACRS